MDIPFEVVWSINQWRRSVGRQQSPGKGSLNQNYPRIASGHTTDAARQVWSPELAKSILLRGTGDGEEVLVALEFLNFPPINGYSKELREV